MVALVGPVVQAGKVVVADGLVGAGGPGSSGRAAYRQPLEVQGRMPLRLSKLTDDKEF